MRSSHPQMGLGCILLMVLCGAARANEPDRSRTNRPGPVHEAVIAHPPLDLSGNARRGMASFYAEMFAGRTMADGTPMHPRGNNAASKTLPLGTTARVTNLETGKSALITIRDRGPYIRGRIVDLSPATAAEIGLSRKAGVIQVEVTPISLPLPDGTIKLVSNASRARARSARLQPVGSD